VYHLDLELYVLRLIIALGTIVVAVWIFKKGYRIGCEKRFVGSEYPEQMGGIIAGSFLASLWLLFVVVVVEVLFNIGLYPD